MGTVIYHTVAPLLFLLVNLNSLTGALDTVKVQILGGKLVSLILRDTVLINGDLNDVLNNATGLQTRDLDNSGELDLFKLNLNHSTPKSFTANLTEFTISNTKLVNGTLYHLLKNARQLKRLYIDYMGELDVSNSQEIDFFKQNLNKTTPNPYLAELTDLTIRRTKLVHGTLYDLLRNARKLEHFTIEIMYDLDVSNSQELDFFKLNSNESTPPNLFLDELTDFTIFRSELVNGTLYDLLKNARNLERIKIENMNELDISNSHELDLFKLNLNQTTPNPFLANLTDFTIRSTKLIRGTLYDLLRNAKELERLTIENMGELDISNWNFNKSDNSSAQFFSSCGNCKMIHIENTQLINGSLTDLLKNAKHLRKLTIEEMGEDFSNRGLSNSNTELFGELTHLRIKEVRLKRKTLQYILKGANKIERLEIEQTPDIDVSQLQNLQIWGSLKTLEIKETQFINGNLHELLKMVTNLRTLIIYVEGKVDISQIYADKLESLDIRGATLTRSRHSEEHSFQNLHTFTISGSETKDSKTLFYNFEKTFPNIEKIVTGYQMIVHPKVVLSMLNSSASYLEFSFDFDPPVKTYEFGEVMKKLISAGYIHGKHTDGDVKVYYKGVTVVQQVRLLKLIREVFSNGTVTEWCVNGHSSLDNQQLDIVDDITPLETKVIIFCYFLLLLVIIGIGTTGNILSGIVLFKTKMENSAGVILFALTFFDTGVILTYLGSAYFNAEIFNQLFLTTRHEITDYTVDKLLWLNVQHSVLAFFIYPLNKTAYTASVYATILISLERFIAVCWPLKAKYLLCRRNSIRAIVSILIFSVLLNMPRWFESIEWNTYSEDSPNWNDYYKPTLMRMESYRTIYHGWIWATFMYILPLILVGVFNFNIFRRTKLSLQVRRSLQSGTYDQTQEGNDTGMSSMTKMLLCVVAVFVVCNSIHIAIVFYFLAKYEQIQLSTTEAISCLPIVINCSVNFLIYVILGKTLRAQFLILLPECARRFCLSYCRKDMTANN